MDFFLTLTAQLWTLQMVPSPHESSLEAIETTADHAALNSNCEALAQVSHSQTIPKPQERKANMTSSLGLVQNWASTPRLFSLPPMAAAASM
jgi:hypothetical protein